MNKLGGVFWSLKLSHKLTRLIITTIVLPLFILSLLFFQNIKESKIKEEMKNIEINFTQNYSQIQKYVEMCSMSTQVILNSPNFWSYVNQIGTVKKVDTLETIYFYLNEIKSMEKLVNSNPYLYQIRIYVESNKLTEMMPILYRMDRLKKLEWASDGVIESGDWQFDYDDVAFQLNNYRAEEHLVALVTRADEEVPAVIEISTRMETLFPDIYQSNDDEWACFIDSKGNIYYDKEYQSKWLNDIDRIINDIPKNNETSYTQSTINGTSVIICYKPLNELGGYLLKIVNLEDDIASVNKLQYIFWICFIIIVIVLIFFSNKLVAIILKQFYSIINIIREVEKGNLEVRVQDCREDEVGELGQQINKMLDRITYLMNDSIKREILVKDSEIRALQNQINAHFIYNVLESVKMMAEVEGKYDISDAVTALGKLLRYSMKWVSKNVTVIEEIDYIRNYLALINLRFDYEIYLSLNIPEKIYQQRIPKMSLQPIIENAICHGIEGIAEDTNIYMKGILYNDYFTIEITDAGRGMSDEQIDLLQRKIAGKIEDTGSAGNGIGLKNVQDRIKISFGEKYGISITSKKDCYTKVIVTIPLI